MKAVAIIAVFAMGAWCLASFRPLAAEEDAKSSSGKIYLVGVGPGDPDLATIRAVRVIESADRVYCFASLGKVAARWARPEAIEQMPGFLAKRFYGSNRRCLAEHRQADAAEAGKRFEAFGAKVRKLVADGKTVAILDAGDATIFGAWAWVTEEFDDLPLEVVPGVSAFNAANAGLKRDVMWGGRRCVVLSGGDVLGVPPQEGRMTTPTVFFTHRAPIAELVPRLLEQYSADTPVAVVSHAGCRDAQEILQATLDTILDRLADGGPPPPYLVYVGNILTLQHKE